MEDPIDATPEQHESESEEEEQQEEVQNVVVDPSTLTPLSPEVISKQVRRIVI